MKKNNTTKKGRGRSQSTGKPRPKVFQLYDRVVRGTIKLWFDGSPYIVLAEVADDFIKSMVDKLSKK